MNKLTTDEHKILVDAIHDSATVIHKGRMMNERIKELAERAGFNNMGIGLIIGIEEYHQKFAELIVKECAGLCEHESNDDEYDQYDMGQSVKAESIKTAIKKHFGVEE